MKKKEFLSAGEAARALGISVKTIQRWDKAGLLPVIRTATNRRRIPVDTVHHLLKGLKQLLHLIDHQEIDLILIEYPDRLVRFGYGYLEETFRWKQVRIEVVEPPPEVQTPTEELVADVLSIVRVFSGRLYGSRAKKFGRVYPMPWRSVYKQKQLMGQAARTTKLLHDLSTRDQGGTNPGKREHLTETVIILNAARRFYLDFFLAQPEKLMERVEVISKKWAEFQTVETPDHSTPLPDWNFSRAFPGLPNRYRRAAHQGCDRQSTGYLTTLLKWQSSGKKKGKPGIPTASNHPTLYAGTFTLELDELDLRKSFIRLKVYSGEAWMWVHYPTVYNHYFERRRAEPGWETEIPTLILSKQSAAIHFVQTKTIKATRFVSDHGLDQHRYQHLERVAKKQWQAGKAVKGERSNQQLWAHVRRQNLDCAHKTARAIVEVCEKYARSMRAVCWSLKGYG